MLDVRYSFPAKLLYVGLKNKCYNEQHPSKRWSFIGCFCEVNKSLVFPTRGRNISRIVSDIDTRFGVNLKNHDITSRIAVSDKAYRRVQVPY